MVLAHALHGLRRAARLPGLALLLWLVNLLLAGVVAAPVALHLRQVLARAPEGDRLLDGFSFQLLGEMALLSGSFGAALRPTLLAVVVLALLANALTSGGVLEVLLASDSRPLGHRFGRGAGRFFGRFLRAGTAALVVAALAGGALSAGVRALARRLEDSAWEPMPVALALLQAALVGGVLVLVLMALDLARIRVVRDDSRRAIRLFFFSLALVVRRLPSVLGLWGANAACVAALMAAYLGYSSVAPARSVVAILLLVLVQQVVAFTRAGLRVALFASQVPLLEALAPREPAGLPGEPPPAVPAAPLAGEAAPAAGEPPAPLESLLSDAEDEDPSDSR